MNGWLTELVSTAGVGQSDRAVIRSVRRTLVLVVRLHSVQDEGELVGKEGVHLADASGVSSVVAGITTTPSLIAASMVSHNGMTLPSSSSR